MLLFEHLQHGFRRITGREWALLILETLGVLAGILIAFALNEWAQQRGEKAQRAQLAERLFDEAQLNVSMLRGERGAFDALTKQERDFATALVRDGICPDEDAWSAVTTVNFYPAIPAQTTAYDEMLASGGLGRVEDPAARKAIADFRSALDYFRTQNGYMRSVSHMVLPVDDPRVAVGFDPGADEPETFHYDRPALCADRGFRARVADAVRDHAFVSQARATLTEAAITACVRLAGAMHRECTPRFGGPLLGRDAASVAKLRKSE